MAEDYEFTEDDRDKQVVSAEGEPVGVVERVVDEGPQVRANRQIPEDIGRQLGFENPGESDSTTSTLQREQIDTVTDDEIRLKEFR